MKKNAPKYGIRRTLAAAAVAACFAAPGALANPTGANVVRGTAAIHQTGNLLQITNSPNAIINWQSFSIGANEITRFLQQSPASAVLNRVTTQNPSTILGALQSNGRVFLINPNGILFGAGAQVDVAGLVASTLNLSDQDFLAGRLRFTDGLGKSVVNDGSIATGAGGSVYLIGSGVTNNGIIRSPQGEVILAAGNSVELVSPGTPNLRVEITAADNEARNLGQIVSEAGRIGIYAGLINHSGTIRADSAQLTADGRIVLKATKNTTLEAGSVTTANGPKGGSITIQSGDTTLVSGTVEATGSEGMGGRIELLGEQVGLISAATVDASGKAGGGSVLVGGDYQGKNPDVQNAARTYVGPDTVIRADAIEAGDGGKVILWADDTTKFYGTISARGGASGGDGGFVETSGKAVLQALGVVDAAAPRGAAGQWLLDPNNITIQTAGVNTNVTPSPIFTSTNDTAIVTTGSIQTALNAGTSVTVTTASAGTNSQLGNITVADAIAKTAGGAATLTLNAVNNITFSGGGTPGNVTSTSGALDLTLNAGGAINTLRTVSLNGGTLTLNATGNVTQSSAIQGNTSVVKNGAGIFTLSQTNTYTGTTTVNAGTVTESANNVLANASSLVVNGGTFDINIRTETVAGVQLLSGFITGTTGILTSTSAYDMRSGTVSAILAGAVGLNKTTAGTVTLSGTGANTYTGPTTVSAGTLNLNKTAGVNAVAGNLTVSGGSTVLQASNQIANTASLAVSGGTFDIGANSETVNGVQLTSGSITGTTGVLTSNSAYDMQAGTASAILAGAVGLNKTTAGTVTLSGTGANTYTGPTTVSAGTLNLNKTAGVNAVAGNLTVSGGSTVLQASNQIANTASLAVSGGTFDIGANSETVNGVQLTSGSITGTTGVLTSNSAYDMQAGTASAILAGAVGLNKTTAGTVTLSGANTYTGTTQINGGTLRLAGGSAIVDTGVVTLANVGSPILDLNGTNETIGSLAGGGNVTLGAGTLTTGGNNTNTDYSGVISGTGGLTKQGTGIFTLSGANTYTGATNITAGTLELGSANERISDLSAVTVAAGATFDLRQFSETIGSLAGAGTVTAGITPDTLTVGGDNTSTTFSGVIQNPAGILNLVKQGTGTFTLSGANTYDGTTTINAGTLTLGANDVLANASSVVVNGGTFDINTRTDTVAGVQLASGSITGTTGVLTSTSAYDMRSGTVSAILGGAVGLDKTTAGTVTLSGANTYTGITDIADGTLRLAGGSAIVDTGVVTLANLVGNPILDLNGTNETIGSLAGGGNVTLGAATLTTGGNNANTTYSGVISGTGGLTKQGTGTFELAGDNTYTGATNIAVGTLKIGANERISDASAVTVAAGATLDLSNFSETIGSLAGAGIVTAGPTADTLTVGGDNTSTIFSGVIQNTAGTLNLTKQGTGTFTLSGANTYDGTTTIAAGTLVASNAAALGATTGGTTVSSGATLNINNVPIGNEATSINGIGVAGAGALTGTGTASLAGTLTLGSASRIGTTSGVSTLTLGGAVSAGGNALDITGAGDLTATNALNNFGTVTINSTGNVSLVDANALTIGASSVGTLTAQTLSGDLTLGGNVTATGTGDTIVLAAAVNFDNTGGFSLAPGGSGRWLVYSTSWTGSTEGGLTSAAGSALPRLYNRTFGANPPASITEPGNHLIYSAQPALAVTPDNKTKVYGTNDPAQTFSGTGFVNDDGVIDTAATAGLAGSFGRVAGETVTAPGPSYLITQGTFTSGAGYSITFDGTRTLTITPAALAATIANQTKVYGVNDPALAGITVNLAGVVNTSVTDWNGTATALNDTGNVSSTLASLTRTGGETVSGSPYSITGGTLNALTGSAAGNYSATLSTAGNTLAITPAALAATIANQTKVYGVNDPALAGITVNLAGVVNTSVTDWNGTATALNDTGNVSSTLASLTRTGGETVSGSPYSITGGTLNALTGSAAGNYSATLSTAGNTLAITPAALAATIANQTKVYGVNDPALAGITVNLAGVVNTSVTDWNGTATALNDTGNVSSTLASLTRTGGETVSGSPYSITGGTLNALTGSAAGNYSATLSTAGNTLAITPAALAATIANQTKVYGVNDPALAGITVNLAGVVNTSVTDWNGTATALNDTGNVSSTLASLTRTGGETVSGSPYSITGGTLNALTGSAAGNYSATLSTAGNTLAITPAALAATIANQTKVYGVNDPALAGITVNLAGVVNTSVTDWNGTATALNDTGNVSSTLASLTRTGGETVSGSPYSITGGTLNALTGSAAGNYSATLSTAGNTLAITPAALAATIANQTKVYGVNDPALAGITVNLAGVVNTSVTDWNGTATALNDTGNVSSTLASLTRTGGETVSGSPYSITGGTLNALTGSAAGNYSATLSTAGNTLAITPAALAATIANQTKVYGVNDPALAGITVNLAGVVNTSVTDWNGTATALNDTGNVSSTLASLTRTGGETVSGSPYSITGGTLNALTGSAAGNYSATLSTAGNTLAITPAALAATIANQTKVYGVNDPALAGITVNLAGVVNTSVTDWNGTATALNDTGNVSSTLASLTRTGGETVSGSPYSITGGTLNALTGSAAGNYSATLSTAGNTLAITPAALAATIANQTKVYGVNDPALAGITVNLAGVVNTSVTDWNGTATALNDTGNVSSTLASLTRTGGETVSGSPYSITGGTLNALTGSAAGNYSATLSTAGNTLAITPAALAATIANQTKVYGVNDPALAGITVNLAGVVNTSVTDWNGTATALNDTGNVSSTLASLTRTGGETVSGSPYSITGGTLNALTGSAAGNYSATLSTAGNTLAITPAALAATIANQTKVYGVNDPALAGITVNLAGVVNTSVTDWNGTATALNDTGNVSSTLASLTRTGGETVSGSPYSITGGTLNALTGSAAGNYSATLSTAGNTLAITPAALAATIANQTKVYGVNDPALAGITVNLAGVVNTSVTDWNGTATALNDTGNVSSTLASLTRTGGETVSGSPYSITGGTLNALTGSAAGNYSATLSTAGNTLAITPAALAATIANQTKVYGVNDPALAGITVNLAGVVNTSVTDWNGTATALNDTGNVSSTLASLTRTGGETVSGSPYSITGGTLNALTGSAAGNYSATLSTAGNTLAITPAALAATIANQTKVYGVNDPALAGITVNLAGVVNTSVTDWNGTATALNDTGNVSSTLASLTRTGGETVSGSPYSITGGTLNALTGSAAGNYSATLSTAGNTLAITPAALAATIANQTKVYGVNDPALAGITVNLAGVVNTSVTDWNGTATALNDTGNVSSTLASLTRTGGETVSGSPYSITGGTLNALTGSAAGNYSATLSTAGNTLAITPAALTVNLTTDASKNYGVNDPSVNATTPTFTGRVNTTVTDWNGTATLIDDTAAGAVTLASLTRMAGETVAGSPYAITGGTAGGTAIANYTPTVNTNGHVLAIAPVALTVTANAQSKTYGAPDPTLTYNAAGLVTATVSDWNGGSTPINDTVAGALSGALTRAAGEAVLGSPYAITQGTLAANASYNITSFTGSNLTVTAAPLAITANNASRPENQPNPPFSASYSGFQFGETPAALTGTLNYSTPATPASPVGSYPITPFGQSSTNYVISYINGTLVVTSGSSPLPPLPPAGDTFGVTNLVVAGFQQLGNDIAQLNLAECSSTSVWAPSLCDHRNGGRLEFAMASAIKGSPPAAPGGAAVAPQSGPTTPGRSEAVAAVATIAPRAPGSALKYNDVMTAVMNRDQAAVIELLDRGWWVDRPDSNGVTPLMAAAWNGDAPITQLLLQRGADPNRRGPGGSVLDYAARSGDTRVIDSLRRAGAR